MTRGKIVVVLLLAPASLLGGGCGTAPARVPDPASTPSAEGFVYRKQADEAAKRGDLAGELRLNLLACEEGLFSRCAQAALALLEGKGIPADPDRALQIYDTMCTRGRALSCTKLGITYDAGELIPRDGAKAAAYHAQACSSPDADDLAKKISCRYGATAMRTGSQGDSDPKRAAEAFKSNCDSGDARSCVALAEMYKAGEVAAPRRANWARAFSEEGCDGSRETDVSHKHCEKIIKNMYFEDGLPLLTRACELLDATGCKLAGLWTLEFSEHEAYRKAGTEFLRQACAISPEYACLDYGESLLRQPGTSGVRGRAFVLGCQAGDKSSCLRLGSDLLLGSEMNQRGLKAACEEHQVEAACNLLLEPRGDK